MIRALLLLYAVAAAAQPALTLTGPASVVAGQPASLTISLTGSSGSLLSALQWSFPAGSVIGTPSLGSTFGSLGLGIYCGATTCLVVGLSPSGALSLPTMSDNTVAVVPITFPAASPAGALQVPLTGLLGVNTTGGAAPVVSGAAYSIKILSKCDANGDGTVNAADVAPILNAIIGKGTCPLAGGCSLQSAVMVISAAMGNSCLL